MHRLTFVNLYTLYMTGVHTTAQRSYNMSRIKGKDTKPEMLVRKFLDASICYFFIKSRKF